MIISLHFLPDILPASCLFFLFCFFSAREVVLNARALIQHGVGRDPRVAKTKVNIIREEREPEHERETKIKTKFYWFANECSRLFVTSHLNSC